MKVLIYSIPVCPWCDKAKDLLDMLEQPYEEVTLRTVEDKSNFKAKTGIKTVPAIYIDDVLIGGYTELATLIKEKKIFI